MYRLKMRIAEARDDSTLFALANDFLACFAAEDLAFLGSDPPSARIASGADVERWLERLTILYCENQGARSMPHRVLLAFFCELAERLEQLGSCRQASGGG